MKTNRKNKPIFWVILIFITLVLFFPLLSLLLTSFKTYESIMEHPDRLLPAVWTLKNYSDVFSLQGIIELNLFQSILNTLFLTVVSVAGVVFSSAFVAYGFTRFKLKIGNVFFTVLMACMFIPSQVLQIPIYEIYHKMHWIDTYWPFLIPPFLGGGIVNVFLVKQFMRSTPSSLFESGEIDGANELRMFFTIALPLIVPVMVTIAIFTFIGSWNDFYGPLIYLNSTKKYTLALLIYSFMFDPFQYTGGAVSRTPWNLVAAVNVLSMVPIFVLFGFAQRYFMEGIALSGIKG